MNKLSRVRDGSARIYKAKASAAENMKEKRWNELPFNNMAKLSKVT